MTLGEQDGNLLDLLGHCKASTSFCWLRRKRVAQ